MDSIRNMKIASTFLGREDHGIPTFWLNMVSEGSGQGFGGYDLRFYGIKPLVRILEVVGVDSWEKLPGSYCRVDGSYSGLKAIGHITDEKWYNLETEGQ